MDDSDLTATERLIWAAFPAGRRVDLRSLADRSVRAGVLRALLLGARPAVAGEIPALRVDGAVITGRLNLSYADLAAPVSLRHCVSTSPAVSGPRDRSGCATP